MDKYPKNHKDVEYYVTGRKKRVAESTCATGDFLAITHEDYPTLTIRQLRDLLTGPTYILDPGAIEVLDAHIKAGYGDLIPTWTY